MVDADGRSPQEWLDVIDRLASILPGDFRYADITDGLAYARAGNIAARLVDDLRGGYTSYFRSVFDELEQLLGNAQPEVRDLLVVGFLEDIQNVSLNSDVKLEAWESWLGERTKVGWKAIIDLWNGKLSGPDLARYIETGVADSDEGASLRRPLISSVATVEEHRSGRNGWLQRRLWCLPPG